MKERIYEEKIVVPEYTKYSRDDFLLLLDPNTAKFCKVNKSGKLIVDKLSDCNGDLNETIKKVSSLFNMSFSKVESLVVPMIKGLIKSGFLYFYSEIPKSIPEYYEDEISSSVYPKQLYLHLTYACNLNCKYCYNKKQREELPRRKGMDISQWHNIIDQSEKIGFESITITGGEPLLRLNDFLEVAQHISESGIYLTLITNGTLITEENAMKIVEVCDAIQVSLDSSSKRENDYLRGKNSFEKTVKGIKALNKERHGLKYVPLQIDTVVTKVNIGSLLDHFEFSKQTLKADNVRFTIVIPQEEESSLLPDFDEYFRLQQEAKKKSLEDSTIPFDMKIDMRSAHFYSSGLSRGISCSAGKSIYSVDPFGNVFPCQALHYPEFKLGNIIEESWEEIFDENPKIEQFKRISVDNIPKCSSCPIRYFCTGGCIANSYNLYGDLEAHNSLFCPYLKKEIIEGLWNIANIDAKNA